MTAIRDSSTALLKTVQRRMELYQERNQPFCEDVVSTLVSSGQELGVYGARVWHIEGEYAVLKYQIACKKVLPVDHKISTSYKPIEDVLRQ